MNSLDEDNFGFTPYGAKEEKEEEIDNFGFTPHEVQKKPRQSFSGSESVDSTIRYLMQPIQGFLATTAPGIVAGFWQLIGAGDALDEEEIERIKNISEREGVPFDRDKYIEAAQNAMSIIPTVSNIASKIEEKTGFPLEPETRGQKGVRFLTEATRLAPEDFTVRGLNTSLPKPVLGSAITATKEGLQEAGVPEPLSEIASFGILKKPTEGAGKLSFSKQKPSGLPERGFEKLNEPTEVPVKKIQQINDKLEKDFKGISDKIIKESPIGETAENLRNDPTFKRDSRELLDQAQIIANESTGSVPSQIYKNALLNQSSKQLKGFALNEYKNNYIKFMKEAESNIVPKDISFGQLVEQYRENNRSLGEYFEPGSSKALNRAKKDVLLDQNRAISSVLETSNPELSKVFKEGNERWTKIMDAETIDNFVSDMFPEGKKVDFKHMKEIFDDPNYQRIFNRSLGEKGTKAFEGAVQDMLTAEKPYKMLREKSEKGMLDFFITGKAFMLNPKLGAAKSAFDILKYTYRGLFNATLDKPRVGFNFINGSNNLKKGNFTQAEKDFSKVAKDVQVSKEIEAINQSESKIQKTLKNSNHLNELENELIYSRQKERELSLEALKLPERISGKFDAVTEYSVMEDLRKQAEKSMKIDTEIRKLKSQSK